MTTGGGTAREGEVNAPGDNRRRQHNKEAPADKRQRGPQNGSLRVANRVSWQCGEWQ